MLPFFFILQVVYRGARKGRGLVVSPRDYSTKYVMLYCVGIITPTLTLGDLSISLLFSHHYIFFNVFEKRRVYILLTPLPPCTHSGIDID